jgi:hypothetical protein
VALSVVGRGRIYRFSGWPVADQAKIFSSIFKKNPLPMNSQGTHAEVSMTLPLIRYWNALENPLPVRTIRARSRPKLSARELDGNPSIHTGEPGHPFDFCKFLKALCDDVIARCPEFSHIDPTRLLLAATPARKPSTHGLQARVTPLRFQGGKFLEKRGKVLYQIQRYFYNTIEFLYLVTFCLPRFLDQDFDEKLITLFHELYHISPQFDGDLRRHEGRYSLHSHSKRDYDRHMAGLAREYLAQKPDPRLFQFLKLNFHQLQHRHGSIRAVIVPHPKIIPVEIRTVKKSEY